MVLQKKFNLLDNLMFFLCNLIIIGFNRDIKPYLIMTIYLLLIYLMIEGNLKRKALFFLPSVIFVIPTLIVGGITYSSEGVIFKMDYLTLFRVMSTLAATGIFITKTGFKEFTILLKYFKVPDFLIEIIVYMYKFTTLMMKNSGEVQVAIENRGGFRSFKNVYRDTAFLFRGIFLKILKDFYNFTLGIQCREYIDKIPIYVDREKIKIDFQKIFISIIYLTVAMSFLRSV